MGNRFAKPIQKTVDNTKIDILVDREKKKVILHFNQPFKWIGFDPTQARKMAQALIENANLLDGLIN